MPDYRELVEYIVRRLVLQPEEVSVTENIDDRGVAAITIRVATSDIGRVIGKKGATINAIRLVAKAAAVKVNDRVDVDIVEDE
ncbi:MAG: KH domain-containing protein [Synergistaceae bacterium]|nr:KH domain-containing protein [Synergistota bacterium]NLM72045.1 KH domain-containing protein [Synergistaceae bacterium]